MKTINNQVKTTFKLVLILSFMFSCQKHKLSNTGYFKDFSADRSPASVKQTEPQSPIQTLIYCKTTKQDDKKCFSSYFGKESQASYDKTQKHLHMLTQNTLAALEQTIQDRFSYRVNFCQKNATANYKRCLKQDLERASFDIMNSFGKKNKVLGHEYIYLRAKFKDKIAHKTAMHLQAYMTK